MAQHDGTILGKALPALSKLVQLPKSQHRKGYCAAGWGPAELQRAAVQSLKAGCESQLKIQPQSTCQNTIGKSSLKRKLGSISNLPDRPRFVASPFARILPSSGPKQTCLAIAYRGMRAPLGTTGHHWAPLGTTPFLHLTSCKHICATEQCLKSSFVTWPELEMFGDVSPWVTT